MKNFIDRVIVAALPVIARAAIRLLRLTMRLNYVNFDAYRKRASEGGQVIVAFWHGRLLMMPYAYHSYPGKRIAVLISRHRDGELVARTVKGFNVETVRGSTTRGWVHGIKGLFKAVRAGNDIAITPDGPRGPRFKAQAGVIQIAAKTGLPIIPLAFGASKKKLLRAGMPLSCPIRFLAAYS